ncbi:MAG: AtpZ/AtpI family protein [Pyrinomonadaceae bacterium]
MNEQQPPEDTKSTPYDLWPDETAKAEVSNVEVPVVTAGDPPPEVPFEAPFIPVAYAPETTDETVRQGGLAWSAGIVFFGSVAFMLFLGWLADLLLGSSPWGLVVGIILGSLIGFIQFFRISSKIFAPKKTEPEHRPFLSRDEDEQ